MSTYNPADYGRSAAHLEQKYDNADNTGEHPVYTTWEWTQIVAQRSTRLGYWDWVVTQIEKEEDRYYRESFNKEK